jgi:4-hydroxy-4-methyl-2-oxoglutarate aldolase
MSVRRGYGDVMDLRDEFIKLGTSTLHEASGQVGALPSGISCMTPGLSIVGPAFPVTGPPGDNLWIHRAVYACAPGDVLVIDVGQEHEAGYWGEVLSCAAKARGIRGVVVDGGVRDVNRLVDIGVPVFARRACMRGTTKLVEGAGRLGETATIGKVEVRRGDMIVADSDGVLAIAAEHIDDVLARARKRLKSEADILVAIERGARTIDIYGLPE